MMTKNEVPWKLFTEELLKEVREQFAYVDWDPYDGKRVYFENAAGSLRLKKVIELVTQETALPDAHQRPSLDAKHQHELLQKGFEDLRLFLGAKTGKLFSNQTASRVAFSINGTIIENIPGTNVVTTALEHPSNFDSVSYFAQKEGKEIRVAECNPVTGGVDAERILERVDRNTCLLSFMYASNITGAVLEVESIIREARRINPDLHIVVDVTQQVAHGPIDVDELNVDGIFFTPYKMFGKRGVGIGYVSDRVKTLRHEKMLKKAKDDWDIGSCEPVAVGCMTTVIDYICWLGKKFTSSEDRRTQIVEGMKAIEFHERGLLERALNGTDKLLGLRALKNVTVHCIQDDFSTRDCVLPITIKGKSTGEVVENYRKEGIIVFDRVNTNTMSKLTLDSLGIPAVVRVTPIHYNSPEEVDAFLKATANQI